MLVLGRREGEGLVFNTKDGPIHVLVQMIGGGRVRLALDMPKSVKVLRDELTEKGDE